MPQFPFGTNEPYYSNTGPDSEFGSKLAGGIVGTGLIGGVLAAGFYELEDGSNLFDKYYKVARTVGNLSPYGLFASVRAAEAVTPFTSKKMQLEKGAFTSEVTWDNKFLKHESTKKWVAAVTGKTTKELEDLDFGNAKDTQMTFERTDKYGRGTLKYGNTVLSDNIMLYERDLSTEAFSIRRTVNQFAEALGTVIDENIKMTDTFTAYTGKVGEEWKTATHQFLPAPSVTGNVDTWEDLIRRSSYFRTVAAFEAQRFNQAIRTIGESVPIVGEHLSKFLRSETFGIRNTTAIKQWGRYAQYAGKLGIAGALVGTYDHLQRYSGTNVLSSALLGYAGSTLLTAGLLMNKDARIAASAGKKLELGFINATNRYFLSGIPKTAGLIGAAATILMPGFDKGFVAGISQTIANLDIGATKIGDITGLSYYRRTLDDIFPGITDNSTAIMAGFAAYGLSQLAFYHENRYYKFAQHFEHLNRNRPGGPLLDTTLDYFNPKKLFSNDVLDTAYTALEKVTNNLRVTDDLEDFRKKHSAGLWIRDTIPWESRNKKLAEILDNPKYDFIDKWGALFGGTKQKGLLYESSHASYKGITLGNTAFVAGLLGWKFLTSGFFGSLKSAQEVSDEYSGKKLVEVRKSRWWGAGSNPYEGGKVAYYKPSLNALIQSDAENKSIWGDEVAKYGPIRRWFLKNFTYHLEEKHAADRPYPVSAPAFSDIPFFGRLLGATIGRIIKPQRFYRKEEWYDEENGYLNVPEDKDSNPHIPSGGLGIGTPINPYSLSEAFGKTQYNMREAEGFIGFLKNSIQSTLTGEETYSSGRQLFADSSQMSSTIRDFWELELGGFASLSEIPRRFLPKERIQDRTRYNPIINDMPSWMPEKFKRGDPYTKIPVGYSRLPGAGYAALHPELKNVDPESYPLIYQYDILANTAYFSTEFRIVRGRVKKLYENNKLTEAHKKLFEQREAELDKLKLKRNYFIESEEQTQQHISKRFLRKMYMDTVAKVKDFAAPLEYLTFGGVRPTHKFLPVGDVIDDYERFAIYGSETSFWELGKAFQDYLGPAFQYITKNLTGGLWGGVPESLKRRREIDQYFDRLNYYKYMMASREAEAEGNKKLAARYKAYAHKTVFGVNKEGAILKQYSVLPTAEKERFEGFRRLTSARDREHVLSLLPEDVKPIMQSVWRQQDGYKPTSRDKKIESDEMKMQQVEAYLDKNGRPPNDWAGWNPHIDMNDVKMKYVEEHNYDPMRFNFWPSQEKMADRKPYLDSVDSPPYKMAFHHNFMTRLVRNNSYNGATSYKTQTDGGGVINFLDDRSSDFQREETMWGSED